MRCVTYNTPEVIFVRDQNRKFRRKSKYSVRKKKKTKKNLKLEAKVNLESNILWI